MLPKDNVINVLKKICFTLWTVMNVNVILVTHIIYFFNTNLNLNIILR